MPADTPLTNRTLYLLDAMALIHRSYYAIPKLTHRGQAVNAVYGFAATLLHIMTVLRPSHIAVAFDEPGPTFRDEDFADYKAHRPETPEELRSQFPLVRRLVSEFGIPSFGVPGFEADDVIGTLARQAQDQGIEAVIVTGDHDAYQLINGKIKVYNVSRGINAAELIDAEAVRKRYGFGPEAVTDYKGLRGDTSDNIPGVPGVGEKTAARLIAEFGSIEKLYSQLRCEEFGQLLERIELLKKDDPEFTQVTQSLNSLRDRGISLSLYKKLCEHSELAFLSKKLATIVTTVPIQLDLDATIVKHYNEAGAAALFSEWGFKSLTSKLPASEAKPSNQQTMF